MAQSNYQVNLLFNANTQQAKAQLQSLQAELNKLVDNKNNIGTNLTSGINDAAAAAKQLQTILQGSTNESGIFDVQKFTQRLNMAGTNLSELKNKLTSMGPAGQQVFQNLARQVTQAQVPIKKTNGMLDKMATTMANTVRWQISASVLQGFMSAIQTSYQYAQDLNESLNNIRIVTSYSVDEMDKFAEKANKAAKALSASTTAYTDAALIYYQQGLGDKAVEERTNTTMKLANVTGQSAETVSEWMTSIWNNFDDGSKSLEYYADVITALGAATASSSEEIATGLEKFAAVAETTGLSYEYATAALATVTAETRQSADVVGTAFKTLFARIQDLELGKTLEDGVTTGKYAQALETVGVQVMEANGDLRDMDLILDDLGKRWDTLTSAQQVSLAQTVAGMRQYNQFLALMSNWDTMQQNLLTAQTSEGELTKQQDIWSESWEAANKRVEAAAQDLYDDLIDDDFFIKITDMFAKIIDGVGDLIDAMGGLRGLLPLLISGMTTLFGQKMLMGVRQFSENMGWSKGSKELNDLVSTTQKEALNYTGPEGETTKAMSDTQMRINEMAAKSTDLQKEKLKWLADELEKRKELLGILHQERIEAESNYATAKAQNESTDNDLTTAAKDVRDNLVDKGSGFQDMVDAAYRVQNAESYEEFIAAGKKYEVLRDKQGYDAGTFNKEDIGRIDKNNWESEREEFKASFAEKIIPFIEQMIKQRQAEIDGDSTIEEDEKALEELKSKKLAEKETEYQKTHKTDGKQFRGGAVSKAKKEIEQDKDILALQEKINKRKAQTTELNKENAESIANEVKAHGERTTAVEKGEKAVNDGKTANQNFNETLDEMAKPKLGDTILGVTQSISSLTMGLSSCVAAFENLSTATADGNLSFKELLSFVTSLSMGLPMLIMGLTSLQKIEGVNTALMPIKQALYATEIAQLKAKKTALDENTFAEQKKQLAEKMGITLDQLEIALSPAKIDTKKAEQGETKKNIILKTIENLLDLKKLAVTLLIIVALGVLIGLIALVVMGIQGLVDAYNADAIAAKKAQEQAEETAKAYENVKTAYDELKKSLEDYQSAQEAIAKLKEGTVEWREAVLEANEAVLSMLDTYPELAQYITNENGVLKISKEGQQTVLDEQLQKVTALSNLKMIDANEAKLAQNKADRTKMLRNELDYSDWANGIDTVLQKTALNAGAGAATGAVFGGIGAGPGAIIGAISGLLVGTGEAIYNDVTASQKAEEALDKIEIAFSEQGQEIFVDFKQSLMDLGIQDQELINTLVKNETSIRDLITSNEELKNSRELIDQQRINNILTSQEHFVQEGYGENVQRLTLEMADKEAENISQDKEDWAKTYFSMYGEEGQEFVRIGRTRADGDTKIVYKDEEGKEQTKWVSEEQLKQIAKEEYLTKQAANLANEVNKMTTQVNILKRSEDSVSQALGHFLEDGSLDYLDPEVFNEIINGNVTISEQQAKLFGYNSVEEATAAFWEAASSYDDAAARANILAREQQQVNTILSQGASELEMSETVLRAYAENLANTSSELADNKKLAATLAVQHYKTAKGVKELRDVLEDNIGTLKDSSASTLDYYEALGAVKDQLEATFGTKVSAEFVEKNLPLIEDMANGSTEALKQLRQELVNDFIINLQIEEEQKAALQSEMQELMAIAENSEIGTEIKFDNTKALEGLNQALAAGTMTVEEVESMFANANLALPQFHMTRIPTKSTSHSETTLDTGWWKTTVNSTTTNTTWNDVPYYGDNPPVYDDAGNLQEGTGVESGLTVTATGNQGFSQDLLSYQGDDDSGRSDFDPKDLDEELDRYHEINKELETYQNNLDRLDILKENAYGAAKLKYMEQELAIIEKENDALQRKNQEIRDYLALDKGAAAAYGAQFDENGNITNYDELRTQWVNEYNASGGSDAASELYDARVSALEKYEDTLAEFYDSENELLEKHYEEISKKLEMVDEKVQHSVELAEFEITLLDHQLEKLEDTAFDSAEAIALLGKKADSTIKQFEATKEGLAETLKVAGFTEDEIARALSGDIDFTGKEITQDLMDQLKNYAEQMLDYDATLAEIAQTVREELLTAFEEANEEFEKSAELIDYNTQMLENYQNIIDIVGKDTLGISDDVLEQMDKAKVAAANSMVQIRKAQAETNRANYEKMLAEYGDDPAWKEQIEEARSIWQESELAFQESFAESLEASAQAFENAVNRVMETYDEAMGGIAGSLQALTEQFERQSELADFYLKDYEKTYEINKLNRQVMQSIDKIDNVKNQRILRDLQSEILSYQTLGKEMSDYDLQYLQKKYDLLVAQIALEESQNAKSQVRLTRDSMGNFGYIYTADQNAVDQAQQTYEDKLYALLQWQDTSINELSGQLLDIQQAYRDAIESLNEDAADYELRVQEITDHYMAMAVMVTGELGDMMVYGKAINDEYGTHAKETFAETLLGNMYTDYTTFEELAEGITAAMQDSVDAVIDKHIEYAETVEEQFDNAGLDFENFGKKVEEETLKITEDVESIGTAAEDMAEDMKTQFDNAFNVVKGFYDNLLIQVPKITEQIGLITGGLGAAMTAYEDFVNKTKEPETPAVPGEGKNLTGGTGGLSNLGDLRKSEYEYSSTSITPTTSKEFQWVVEDAYENAYQPLLVKYKGIDGYYKADDIKLTNKDNLSTVERLPAGKFNLKEEMTVKRRNDLGYLAGFVYAQFDESGTQYQSEEENTFWDPTPEESLKIDGYKRESTYGYIYHLSSPINSPYGKTYYITLSDLQKYSGQNYSHQGILSTYQLRGESYDTGGYTGSWGPEGRLAMLHQKEIVLNAHDTKNLLDTVSIVRSIVDQIELSALASQQGIGILRAAAVKNTTDAIQQNVTIEAHFPNATDHNEIEQAFNNLVNDAAQYANRKE